MDKEQVVEKLLSELRTVTRDHRKAQYYVPDYEEKVREAQYSLDRWKDTLKRTQERTDELLIILDSMGFDTSDLEY